MTLPRDPGHLEPNSAMKIAKDGITDACILNPGETWKASEDFRDYHCISIQALIGKSETKRLNLENCISKSGLVT